MNFIWLELLPRKVRERLIRIRHAVGLLARRHRLAFLLEGGAASWSDIIDGLRLTGHFLMRDVLTDRAAPMFDGRERLVDRLRRAAGVA